MILMKGKIQFVFKWIWVTSLGWFAAQFLGLLLTKTFYPSAKIEAIDTAPLFWLVFGLSQWFVLRDQIHSTHLWILATAIGFYIGALLLKVLTLSDIIVKGLWAHILGSAILGLAQYIVLRRRIKHAGWCLLTTTISWVLAQQIIGVQNLGIQPFGILIFTVITGFAMAWLLQYHLQDTA